MFCLYFSPDTLWLPKSSLGLTPNTRSEPHLHPDLVDLREASFLVWILNSNIYLCKMIPPYTSFCLMRLFWLAYSESTLPVFSYCSFCSSQPPPNSAITLKMFFPIVISIKYIVLDVVYNTEITNPLTFSNLTTGGQTNKHFLCPLLPSFCSSFLSPQVLGEGRAGWQ